MKDNLPLSWEKVIKHPISGRLQKPRQTGLTMVIDKGLGLNQTKDILEMAHNYLDCLKLGFGTSALYPQETLLEKIRLVKEYNIDIYPGGTFFEAALLQDKLDKFLQNAKNLGFNTIEISDGTIFLDTQTRLTAINKAISCGFKVITEVGKKDSSAVLDWDDCFSSIDKDLKAGAFKVIIEGRESGKGVGMYDNTGAIKTEPFKRLSEHFDINQLIFEAPLKSQQQELLAYFGPNVNLGNIDPNELIALEALRVGLRGDTLKLTI